MTAGLLLPTCVARWMNRRPAYDFPEGVNACYVTPSAVPPL